MAVARHLAICPPMDTCLSLIEEAMKQEECSKPIPRLPCSPAKGNPGGSKGWREKLDYERAQDKHMLASSLGLVRTDLFPRIQALMEWRRRRRLRRQRQSKLGSSSAEPPSNAVTVSLPVSSPVNTCLHKKPEKEIPIASTSIHKKVTRKSQNIPAHVPQSDRSTRSKGVKPDVITASTGKQCVKTGDRVTPPSKCRDKAKAKTVEVVRNQRSPALKTNLSKSSMRGVDKAKVRSKGRRETSGMAMREGVNDGTPDSPPPSMDQEKHQSKRALPTNPLDSDFVSDSHQSTGEATAAKGKEEKSVDGSSQAGELLPCRVLRTRGPPIIPPMTRAREERSNKRRHHVSKSAGPEAATSRPKVKRKEGAEVMFLLIFFCVIFIVVHFDTLTAN